MLFKDRLEIWNPGTLPYGLTPAKLKEPEFIQEEMFRTVIWRKTAIRQAETPVAPPVGDYVLKLLLLLLENGAMSNNEIRTAFDLKDRRRLRETYIDPAFAGGFIEYTVLNKPNSRLQKYRLTEKGKKVLKGN